MQEGKLGIVIRALKKWEIHYFKVAWLPRYASLLDQFLNSVITYIDDFLSRAVRRRLVG